MSQITVQCRLVASEETRQYLWHLMADIYTPFVNEMIKQVQEASDFEQWCQTGKVPADVFEELRKALKERPPFKGLPGRWYYAGRDLVKRIYKSRLARHIRLRNQLAGQNLLNSFGAMCFRVMTDTSDRGYVKVGLADGFSK